jgi:hypothetical protein
MTPEQVERARDLYENTDARISSICDQMGLTRSSLYRLRRKSGWIKRAVMVDRKRQGLTTLDQLQRMIEEQLNTLSLAGRTAGHPPKSLPPDQAARTFASLVKTLGQLKRLQSEDKAKQADGASENIETLRGILAQRLDKLRAQSGSDS